MYLAIFSDLVPQHGLGLCRSAGAQPFGVANQHHLPTLFSYVLSPLIFLFLLLPLPLTSLPLTSPPRPPCLDLTAPDLVACATLSHADAYTVIYHANLSIPPYLHTFIPPYLQTSIPAYLHTSITSITSTSSYFLALHPNTLCLFLHRTCISIYCYLFRCTAGRILALTRPRSSTFGLLTRFISFIFPWMLILLPSSLFSLHLILHRLLLPFASPPSHASRPYHP